ncbi:hypothetical protein E5N72_08640 [Pseudoalteromonas sp. MEBiC 03607]|uniref:tyrosine-type recombinase/integrase n=1 Tax=Pseudoalteromonas sp. MEBiC 03607 TaxID=2563601 RepID=UPI001093D967|nr:tyrosine-type recombinase/integrase [Pseudoalteromonas sp. MEBiC 03607]TGV20137.1 hypothetical protein E5N72_08640 [Pseudoalteromonas sp. MEBiC 03607]
MAKWKRPSGYRGIAIRGNTYFARLTVPEDVREVIGKSEFWKTLETDDIHIAQKRAALYILEWKAQIKQARGASSAVKDALQWKRELEAEKRREAPLIAQLQARSEDGQLCAHQVNELGLGSKEHEFSEYLDQVADRKGPDAARTLSNIVYGESLPCTTYLEEWLKSQEGKLIPRTIKQRHTAILRLNDKFPVLPIKKTEVARWIIEQEAEGKAEATIKGLIGSCRSFYDYLMRMGYLDPEGVNPFEGHKYSKKKKASRKEQRQAWEVEDVIKLVAKAKSKSGDANLHDLILLGAYTGARIEEIAQLKVEDVKTKDGITFLSIDESKSNAGLRDIPVHNDILPLVNSLAESSPDGYLLPNEKITSNGERSSAIGKRFGRLKRSLGYDERYVFHSLRKTLSTLLERLGLHHNQAAEITGHEKVGETYGTYSVGLTIVEKAELLNRITYQGLNVEPKEGKRRP